MDVEGMADEVKRTNTTLRRMAGEVRVSDPEEGKPRTVEVVASSETPVRVWGEDEVLSHKRDAVDLSRFKDARVLVDHRNEVGGVVGKVVSARIVDRQLIARAELAPDDLIGNDLVARLDAGLLRDVSIGYKVYKWERTRDASPDAPAEYTATRWAPHEFSFVAVGADPAAQITGVRADYGIDDPKPREVVMTNEVETRAETVDTEAVAAEARAAVVKDNSEMFKFADEYKSVGGPDLAREVMSAGGGMSELKERVFEAMNKRLDEHVANSAQRERDAEIGLTKREAQSFSFVRLANALHKPGDASARNAAGFELEAAAEAGRKVAEDSSLRGLSSGMVIPTDVLRQPIVQRRDTLERVVNVGNNAAGGFLVAEQLLASSYIDILRARSAILDRATVLNGLVGNLDIPRLKTSVDPSWVAETSGGDQTLSDPAWDEVTLSPKKMYCGTPISHTALVQTTPEVEALVRMDILAQEVLKLDTAAFEGTGAANQPTGIRNTADVNEVTPSAVANGAVLDRDLLIDMRTEIAKANGIEGGETYFMHPLVGGFLRKTLNGAEGASEGFLWDNRTPERPVNGEMAVETTTISATGTKGNGRELSNFFFGNPRALFVGYWGGLDIQVDPYTQRRKGSVVVSVIRFADFALRHPQQFSFIKETRNVKA